MAVEFVDDNFCRQGIGYAGLLVVFVGSIYFARKYIVERRRYPPMQGADIDVIASNANAHCEFSPPFLICLSVISWIMVFQTCVVPFLTFSHSTGPNNKKTRDEQASDVIVFPNALTPMAVVVPQYP